MKSQTSTLTRSARAIVSIAAFTLLCSATDGGFSRPAATTTLNNPEEINQILVQNVGNESNYFANSIGLNGSDVYRYMTSTGSNTVAIYFGYSMAGNYNNTNKVIIVAPVDRNYKTMMSDCLLYNSSNMSFQVSNFGDDQTAANSSRQNITTPLAKAYITNFEENPNKPEIRGVLLQRSTLDKMLKNNGGTFNNLKLSFGKSAEGNTVVIASAMNAATRGLEVELLDGSSLCPNNCDFY